MSNADALRSIYAAEFYSQHERHSVKAAAVMLPLLFDEIYRPTSICDFGCGAGAFLMVAKKLGVPAVLGIDGPHLSDAELLIDRSEFMPHDLELPLNGFDRTFDLAISLEVAEHLTAPRAQPLVDFLTRAAPVVLFSAAIPQQGGTHHVNEQWPRYWLEKFEARGFIAFDCLRRRLWDHPDVVWWYAQNTFLFVAASQLRRVRGIEADMRTSRSPALNLVHPTRFLHRIVRD